MDLLWGEDYDVLADVAQSVFNTQSPLTDREHKLDYASQVKQFTRLDWLTLGDPRCSDDYSAGVASMVTVFVEQGRALVYSPLLPLTTARDASLLCNTAVADDLAARIGDGTCAAMPAFCDPAWRVAPPTLHARRLTGTVLAVPYADNADVFLVEAVEVDDGGCESAVLLSVPRDRHVAIDPMPNLGEHSMFAVTFSGSPMSENNVHARGSAATAAIERANHRASILLAGQIYGAGLNLLAKTVRYACEREQFDGPIGRFQAVQYLCTDIAVGVHLTSAFIRDAARLIDAGAEPNVELALLAKQARSTAEEMVHAAHEVHAGIGFMVESDVHLFTKAVKKWAFELGEDHRHDRAILDGVSRELIGEDL